MSDGTRLVEIAEIVTYFVLLNWHMGRLITAMYMQCIWLILLTDLSITIGNR